MARELTRAEIRWLERKERDEAIQRLRDDGYTIREIAAETGVSVGTVHNGLRRMSDDLDAMRVATAKERGWEYTPSPRPTVKEINSSRKRNQERRQQREADQVLRAVDPEAWERLEEQRAQKRRRRHQERLEEQRARRERNQDV